MKKIFKKLRWFAAKEWLRIHPNVDIVCVAGSVGKTTTKEIIAKILQSNFKVVYSSDNLDPIFNLPLTALRVRGNEKFVAEMGIDAPGQMSKYLTLLDPRIAVLTQLSIEHTDSDHFGSWEKAIEEELKIINGLPPHGWLVGNGDDKTVTKAIGEYIGYKLTYGFDKRNDIVISSYSLTRKNDHFISKIEINYGLKTAIFSYNLLGKPSALAVAAGVVVGMLNGLTDEQIQKGLSAFEPYKGRLSPKRSTWGGLVIDDSYNASPESVKAAINVAIEIDKESVLVLGDMRELGEYSANSHFDVGKYAADNLVKKLMLYGSEVRNTASGYLTVNKKGNVQVYSSFASIVAELEKTKPNTVIVKGSRGMEMENIISKIT